MIGENNQKRIITNEEIFESIQGLKMTISKLETDVSGLKTGVSSLKEGYKDLRQSTVDGFDRVFQLIDETKRELKEDIFTLRKETNQRFTIVENRLSNIEDNMVYKHELSKQFV